MKIITIVGARPQFIKAAAVSRVIREKHQEILVHTGQHYDSNMSNIFFEELNIPKPDYNLNVGSGSHAVQTAEMLIGIEECILKEKPDMLMVYGDTNSTLAGAIAASKLLIPIIHIEAGLRSYNMAMPEEQNRILTDRISSFLFCPTQTAVDNLKKEGITNNVFNVGDVMCDAVLFYLNQMKNLTIDKFLEKLIFINKKPINLEKYYLTTIHRAENTASEEKVTEILRGLNSLDFPVIFPVHPRTKSMTLEILNKNDFSNVYLVEPVGYTDMLYLTKNAVKVVTDSGGLQKECYILNTPCVTVRDQTEWVETLIGQHNVLCEANHQSIINCVLNITPDNNLKENYYGIGDAAKKIVERI
jgi:UDP-GlcNAc3NAcA epimerase